MKPIKLIFSLVLAIQFILTSAFASAQENNGEEKNTQKTNQSNKAIPYQIDFPTISFETDYYNWLALPIGIQLKYQNYYIHLRYRYTLPFNLKPSDMTNSGELITGLNFYGFDLNNSFEVGTLRSYKNEKKHLGKSAYESALAVKDYISFKQLLYSDISNNFDLIGKAGLKYYLQYNELFYDSELSVRYFNRHYWGEFISELGISQADKLSQKSYDDLHIESGKAFQMFSIDLVAGTPQLRKFNTAAFLNLDYRFFFLTPLGGNWRNVYIGANAFYATGYRLGHYSLLDDLKDFWWIGGQVGFIQSDSLVFHLGLLYDKNQNFQLSAFGTYTPFSY